jgi:hypothetical protein
MPLLDLWKTDQSVIKKMTIEQIVSLSGDGKALDASLCQKELRQYLSETSTEKLEEYAVYCLENSFAKSGLILQDVINELGRRLEYSVENGLYQGVKGKIGFDGLWESSDSLSLVVEVKTTDAYRLSLDTLATYRNRLIDGGRLTSHSACLIVVGRTDTGELEAQLRGSKHAWHMRIIGIDSLVKLVKVKEVADNVDTIQKVRALLTPLEYTRLDDLVDVVFTAAKDVEDSLDSPVEDTTLAFEGESGPQDKTSTEILAEKRECILSAVGSECGVSLVKKTRATYWSSDHKVRIVCTVSKRYKNQGVVKYWYAYHPAWDDFLSAGESGYLVLGCVDINRCFSLPLEKIKPLLGGMNTTTKKDGSHYWHVKITEPHSGAYYLQLPNEENIALVHYEVTLGDTAAQ